MRTAIGHLAIGILTCITGACNSGPENPRTKQIYSVLQSEEYDLRNRKVDRAFVYSRNVMGSNFDTIAFPIADRRQEYIVFLANPKNEEGPYSVPSNNERSFILHETTFKEIVEKKYITKSLQDYLREHVTPRARQ